MDATTNRREVFDPLRNIHDRAMQLAFAATHHNTHIGDTYSNLLSFMWNVYRGGRRSSDWKYHETTLPVDADKPLHC